ncbi:MAG: acyl-CoA dehydrogenase family protein, partial [Acidimicrobiales bacterium]
MLLTLHHDQELFRETTAKLLGELAPAHELRRLRDDPDGFDDGYWRRGAELGWTSLLVGEDHGGGSIGGQGLVDLALVAYEFGRHAAPGPLAVTNIVAAALSETGHHGDEVIGSLLSGDSMA